MSERGGTKDCRSTRNCQTRIRRGLGGLGRTGAVRSYELLATGRLFNGGGGGIGDWGLGKMAFFFFFFLIIINLISLLRDGDGGRQFNEDYGGGGVCLVSGNRAIMDGGC